MGLWHAFHNLSILDPDSLKQLKEATWVENGVHRQSPGDSEEGTDLEDREMGLTRGKGEVPQLHSPTDGQWCAGKTVANLDCCSSDAVRPSVFETGSLIGRKLTRLSRLLGHGPSGTSLPLHPQGWNDSSTLMHLKFFTRALESKARSSCVQFTNFTNRAIFPPL